MSISPTDRPSSRTVSSSLGRLGGHRGHGSGGPVGRRRHGGQQRAGPLGHRRPRGLGRAAPRPDRRRTRRKPRRSVPSSAVVTRSVRAIVMPPGPDGGAEARCRRPSGSTLSGRKPAATTRRRPPPRPPQAAASSSHGSASSPVSSQPRPSRSRSSQGWPASRRAQRHPGHHGRHPGRPGIGGEQRGEPLLDLGQGQGGRIGRRLVGAGPGADQRAELPRAGIVVQPGPQSIAREPLRSPGSHRAGRSSAAPPSARFGAVEPDPA